MAGKIVHTILKNNAHYMTLQFGRPSTETIRRSEANIAQKQKYGLTYFLKINQL